MKAKNAYIVTDEEDAIVDAIKKYMKIPSFRCQNHVKSNAVFKLKNLNVRSKAELAKYMDSIDFLLEQETEDSYNREYLKLVLDSEEDDGSNCVPPVESEPDVSMEEIIGRYKIIIIINTSAGSNDLFLFVEMQKTMKEQNSSLSSFKWCKVSLD